MDDYVLHFARCLIHPNLYTIVLESHIEQKMVHVGDGVKVQQELTSCLSRESILRTVRNGGVTVAAWAARLLSDLDEADQRATGLVQGLREEQLNWRPDPRSWSIGQCLDHLCVTNDVYLPPIAQALEGEPKGAASEITPGWFGRFFLKKVVEPSPESSRLKAPKKIVPSSRVDTSVLDRFLVGNRSVRQLIERAREYDVNRIRFRNPFVPLIRFTVGTGLKIVTRHEHRHLLQAQRVKEADGFPR